MIMKKLIILGAGTGGTIMANKMRKKLPGNEWMITVVDQDKTHYYQPGFLFIPFGYYKREDIIKQKKIFLPDGVTLVCQQVERIDSENNTVLLSNGEELGYDILIIATGTKINPEETVGLKEELWYKHIFDFYTIEGAEALSEYFKTWPGGNLVVD
jgi:sulfide:quinone oxidoreductase